MNFQSSICFTITPQRNSFSLTFNFWSTNVFSFTWSSKQASTFTYYSKCCLLLQEHFWILVWGNLFAVCHSQYYWNKFVQIVAKTLKLCNDVESNPGPSKSERDQTQFEKFCEAYKKAHSSLFKKEAQKKAICHM